MCKPPASIPTSLAYHRPCEIHNASPFLAPFALLTPPPPPVQSMPPSAVLGLRAVSGVLTGSGVEGLVALVRAVPSIEEVRREG